MHLAAAAAMKVCASAAAALSERRCRRARQETTCGEQLNEERTDNSATLLLPTLPTPGCRRVVGRGGAAHRRRRTQDVRRLVDLFLEWQRERALRLLQLPERG